MVCVLFVWQQTAISINNNSIYTIPLDFSSISSVTIARHLVNTIIFLLQVKSKSQTKKKKTWHPTLRNTKSPRSSGRRWSSSITTTNLPLGTRVGVK